MKKYGMQTTSLVVLVVLAVAGGIVGSVYLLSSGGPLETGGGGDEGPITTKGACGTDNFNDLQIADRNVVNASSYYLPASVIVEDSEGNVIVGSTTLTSGTTVTYTNANVPCADVAVTGKIKSLMTTLYTSAEDTFSFATSPADIIELAGGRVSTLKLGAFLTTTGTNTTNSTTDTNFATAPDCDGSTCGCHLTEVTSYTDGTTVGSGGTFSRYIDFIANETSTQFGSTVPGKPGIGILVDNNNSAAFRKGDIKISKVSGDCEVERIECSDPALDSASGTYEAEDCFVVAQGITANDVVCRVRLDGTASSGNPANDPRIYFVDLGYVQDTDGAIKWLARDSGGTDVGGTDCSLTLNLA